MKMEIRSWGIDTTPEDEQDHASLRDTLGAIGDKLPIVERSNVVGLKTIAHLTIRRPREEEDADE